MSLIRWLMMAFRLWKAHGTLTSIQYGIYLLTAARNGKWEWWLKDLVPDSGRVAVDVGASFGQWTSFLSQRFRFVVAFEPHEPTFFKLMRSRNGNVAVYPYALWNKEAKLQLVTYPDSRVNRIPEHDMQYAIGNGHERIDVAGRTLDSFGIDLVDFIKVDAEGAEVQVLEGAEETIKRSHPMLIVELHSEDAGHQCCHMLNQWGYTIEIKHFPLYRKTDPKYHQRLWIVARYGRTDAYMALHFSEEAV